MDNTVLKELKEKYNTGNYICYFYDEYNWLMARNITWFEHFEYVLINKKHEDVLNHFLSGGEIVCYTDNETSPNMSWNVEIDFIGLYDESYEYRIIEK